MEREEQREKLPQSESYRREEMEEISLREIIEVLLKGRNFIIFIVVLCLLGSFVFTRYFQGETYAGATVAVNFEQVEEGIYPSGRSFSQSDIVSPYVLGRVVEELALDELGLRSSELQRMLALQTLYRGDEEEGREPLYHYRLRVTDHPDIPLHPQMKRRILSSIVENYRRAFSDEFIAAVEELPEELLDELPGELPLDPFSPLFTLDEEELLLLDYPLAISIVHAYQDMLIDFSAEMSREAEGFRSRREGFTFEELKDNIEALKNIRFPELAAQVSHYSLVRDREGMIIRYRDRIRELQKAWEKKEQESIYARELLQEAAEMRTGAILPADISGVVKAEDIDLPAVDIFKHLYEDNFYTRLVHVTLDAAVESIDKRVEIEYLRSEVERLEEAAMVDDATVEQLREEFEGELATYVGRLNSVSGIYNEMVSEYQEKLPQKSVSYMVVPHYIVEGGNLQLNLAVAAVLGLMLGVFVVFFQHYWQSSK